ncbi:hypothetical protein BGZ82_010456, partial [Podila clonocystis]
TVEGSRSDNYENEGTVNNGDDDEENDIDLPLDEDDQEIEGDMGDRSDIDGDSSGYSRTTLKAYAKFRLLSVDRRFGISTKYIFMLFDWAQKKAVFGFHNRRAPIMRDGRKTCAEDVRERSTLHSGNTI